MPVCPNKERRSREQTKMNRTAGNGKDETTERPISVLTVNLMFLMWNDRNDGQRYDDNVLHAFQVAYIEKC